MRRCSTRERELERLISGKGGTADASAEWANTPSPMLLPRAEELDALTADLEQVQSRIRETSPQYAALTQPAPLNLREIQTRVLDSDTVLLEYALGTEKKFPLGCHAFFDGCFRLPPRAEIESAAKRVYELLTARNQKPAKETPAARAARVRQADEAYFAAAIKGEQDAVGAGSLADQRQAAVDCRRRRAAVSALRRLAGTGARASGAATPVPLIVKHEIITAPSASVVAVLRQETAGRKPAEKALAVLADPVFSADDARIAQQKKAFATAAAKTPAAGEANRSAADTGCAGFCETPVQPLRSRGNRTPGTGRSHSEGPRFRCQPRHRLEPGFRAVSDCAFRHAQPAQ